MQRLHCLQFDTQWRGCDTIVAEALGSRRFEVIVRGPGGHSWSDFGIANPIPVLARAIHLFTQVSVPASPKTTFNIGVIHGGTSVNSIPESASMRVDIRSSSASEMERIESALRNSIARAVDEECQIIEKRGSQQKPPYGLSFEVIGIGDRPAGDLNPNARILHVIRAVDAEAWQCGDSATSVHGRQHPTLPRPGSNRNWRGR